MTLAAAQRYQLQYEEAAFSWKDFGSTCDGAEKSVLQAIAVERDCGPREGQKRQLEVGQIEVIENGTLSGMDELGFALGEEVR